MGRKRETPDTEAAYADMADTAENRGERLREEQLREETLRKLRRAIDREMSERGAEKQETLSGLLWSVLLQYQKEPFYTVKGLEFTYYIRGNELFVNRKDKSITRASVDLALKKAVDLNLVVSGPKKLTSFGASYLYPIFLKLGIIRAA